MSKLFAKLDRVRMGFGNGDGDEIRRELGEKYTRWKELFTEKSSARFAERLIEKYKVQRYRTFRDNARPKFIML